MNLTRFNPPKNFANGYVQKRGGAFRREHLHFCRTFPAAGGKSSAPRINNCAPERFNRDNRFLFSIIHLLSKKFFLASSVFVIIRLTPIKSETHNAAETFFVITRQFSRKSFRKVPKFSGI